jgi:hypothetical protein
MRDVLFEFLRLVVNETRERRFELRKEVAMQLGRNEMISGNGKEIDILKVMPEMAREFAGRITKEFRACYELKPHPQTENCYVATDPISGLSIRLTSAWDPMHLEFLLRFDALFSEN